MARVGVPHLFEKLMSSALQEINAAFIKTTAVSPSAVKFPFKVPEVSGWSHFACKKLSLSRRGKLHQVSLKLMLGLLCFYSFSTRDLDFEAVLAASLKKA